MNKFLTLTLSTALAGVLSCSLANHNALAKETSPASLVPQSDWIVKPIGANTPNGYCAMSRQYDQNMILTFGQNTIEEYSLAIDFVDAPLNIDKAYNITLQPGPGQIRAYEMMPASARAMVIRLGFDDTFLKSLKESGELTAEIDGKNYSFDVSQFASAESELKECREALSRDIPIQTANDDVAGFSAEKIEGAEPIKQVMVEESVETSEPKEIVQEPLQIELEKVASNQVDLVPEPPPINLERAAPEIEIVSQDIPVAEDPSQAIAIEPAQAPKPIVMSKVSSQVVENEEESQTLSAQKAMEIQRQAQEIAEQQESLTEKIPEQPIKLAKANITPMMEPAKPAALVDDMSDIPDMPKPFSQFGEAEKEQIQNNMDGLKQENERLTSEMKDQEKRLSEVDHQSPEAEAELQTIRARMQQLEEENRQLYLEARKARGEIDQVVVDTSNQALAKIHTYENKLEAAQADNMALSREIEELKRMQQAGHLGAVSGDVDLEKASARYDEAQKEIDRLGMLLEQQRVAHRKEKTQLEQMLFDPSVTNEEQRRRLNELETKLAATEAKLQNAEKAPVVSAATNEELQRQQQEMQTLQAKLAEAEQKRQAAEQAAIQAKAATVSVKPQYQNMDTSDLKKQLAAAQIELKNAEAFSVETASKAAEIERQKGEMAAMKEKLAAAEQKLRAVEQSPTETQAAKVETQRQQQDITMLQANLAAAEEKLKNADQAAASAKGAQEELQNQQMAMVQLQGRLVAAQQELKAAQQSSVKAAATEEEELKRQQAAMTELQTKLAASQQQLQTAQQSAATATAAETELQRKQQDINNLQTKLTAAEQKLQTQKTMPVVSASAVRPVAQVPAETSLARAEPSYGTAIQSNEQMLASLTPRQAPQENIYAQPSAPSPSSLRAPTPVSSSTPTPMPVAVAAPSPSQFDKGDIQQLLSRSGVGVNGNISESGNGRYQWKAGMLKGNAQVVKANQVGGINSFVNDYLAKAKSSCNGDFASLPATASSGKAYEVACVSSTVNTSSSVVFAQKGEDIIVIGHEISADDMDVAMDVRDRIAHNL